MPASNDNRPVLSPAMDDTPADAARVSRCSIILVHGTWGRGFFPKRREVSLYPPNKRYWFEEGSQFCAGLDAALKNASLDWPIRAFLWSGANSVHARDRAATDLSKQLREDLKDPDTERIGGLMIFGVFFGSLILFFVPGAFKSFFGREFLVNGMTCDIAVDSVPDTLGQVEAITLGPFEVASSKPRSLERPFSLRWMWGIFLLEFRGIYYHFLHDNPPIPRIQVVVLGGWQLRHGIYNHPNCVDEIVRWLRRVT